MAGPFYKKTLEELDLIEAVLRGYSTSMARADALLSIAKLKRLAMSVSIELQSVLAPSLKEVADSMPDKFSSMRKLTGFTDGGGMFAASMHEEFATGGLVPTTTLFSDEVPCILSRAGETVLPNPKSTDITASNVVVDRGYHWQPMATCPVNSKVQLLGKGGIPQYGYWDGKNPFWTGWAPIPTRDPNAEQQGG